MSAAFVPLVPGALPPSSLSAPARLKPISSSPAPFKVADPAEANSQTASVAPHGPPKIALERQGEAITHIRIECSCGQVTELKCEY